MKINTPIRLGFYLLNAAGAFIFARPASAFDTGISVHPGATIQSSDNKVVGRAGDISGTGTEQTVEVIFEDRIIHIPVASLQPTDKGRLISSMTKKQIEALR